MYRIVLRSGNTGRVVGKAKTKAGAYKAKVRCEKKHNRACVVMSGDYVDPSFAGFGSPPKLHKKEAVSGRQSFRLERKVILGHLRKGECGAAVRGLVMAGYVQGYAQAHKNSTGARRSAKGRLRAGNAPAAHLLSLAWKITDACKISNR